MAGSVASQTVPGELDASHITIVRTSTPKSKVPKEQLSFGSTFTDHMVEIDWTAANGWSTPVIKPFDTIPLSPAALVFHYSLECFEGMKAYKDSQGKLRLFRPELNIERFYCSCKRMALPTFDTQALLDIIKAFVKVDSDWIPEGKGYSLYIRPTMIATQPTLSVSPTATAKLLVIGSPVGPYYKTGFAPVSLLADAEHVRAWPGGVGAFKCGGNYAPGIMVQEMAAKKGYNQVLWLLGDDHKVTEVGTMNLFLLWVNDNGEKELITAPLDGTILPGVTRDTILKLTQTWAEFKVTESFFTMADLINALEQKRVIEMFGAGTACIVSPIKNVGYMGKDYSIPLALGTSGELTKRLNDTILDIQYGETASAYSVVID